MVDMNLDQLMEVISIATWELNIPDQLPHWKIWQKSPKLLGTQKVKIIEIWFQSGTFINHSYVIHVKNGQQN